MSEGIVLRRISRRLSFASTLIALIAVAGCGGGSSGSSTPSLPISTPDPAPSSTAVPPVTPGPPAAPGSATFTVYTALVDGQTLVSLAPYGTGAPDSTHAWSIAPGAYVIYPDKSIQLTDNTGSFDASKASWTIANAGPVAFNPNSSPALRIAAPSSKTPAVPLFEPVLPLNTFDSAFTAGGPPPSNFSDLTIVPSSQIMFDDEVRTFEAVGQDTNGGLVNVGPAVQWSLQVPVATPACPNGPAGTLVVDPANPSLVTNHPPANGSFTGSCYDQIVAKIPTSNPAAPISATSNAIYFPLGQAVTFPGKVVTASGAPVANGVVDIYGAGPGGFGDFLALTNGSGGFVRNIPQLRSIIPFVDNLAISNAPSTSAWSVSPTTIPAGPAGGHLPSSTLVETGPFVPSYTAPPQAAFNLVNSFDVANSALLDVGFGLPGVGGTLPNCSVQAFVIGQSTPASCNGQVGGGGVYSGYSVSAAAGGFFTFLQPPSSGGQVVLAVQSGITNYTDPNNSGSDPTAPQCSVTAPCVYYARYYNAAGFGPSVPAPLNIASLPAGTVLQVDGVYSAVSAAPNYNVNLIRNVYSPSFQTLGSPQRSHAEAFQYPFGATSVNFSDHWYNTLGMQGGSFNFSRAQTFNGTTLTGYTLAGSGTQQYFRTGFPATTISYTLTNGSVNLSQNPVIEKYTTTAVNTGPIGSTVSVTWTWNGLAVVGSTATGSLNNPSNPPFATFSVDTAGDVTLTQSGGGGDVYQFLL
jgi:hypothetical protein